MLVLLIFSKIWCATSIAKNPSISLTTVGVLFSIADTKDVSSNLMAFSD